MVTATESAMAPEDSETQETWEMVVPGGVRVWKRSRRTGEYETVRMHGTKGPKKLRISKDERLYNQELIPEESKKNDPFENGSMVLLAGGKRIGVTDADLEEYLQIGDIEIFTEALQSIGDKELLVRRLYRIAEKQGTMAQVETIRELLDARYRVGGTQPTVEEMMAEGDNKGELIS